MSLDFSIPNHPEFSLLSPEQVHFFYYDIGLAHLGLISDDSIWEKIMEEFKDRAEICVSIRKEIPEKVERNTVRFTLADKSDKTSSFFRHLRNSFAHHRIHQCNDMLHLIDEETKIDRKTKSRKTTITMRGYVEYELLKENCFRFFEMDNDIRGSLQNEFINPPGSPS